MSASTRIVLVGANSQVGSEVALHLQEMERVDVVCLVRSSYSALMFDQLGLEHHVVDYSTPAAFRPFVADADLVVDCTYPSGQITEIPSKIEKILGTIAEAMQPGSRFAYFSSIMAWGTGPREHEIRYRYFPRTSYASIKRHAELTLEKLCKKHRLQPYNLRLGQVHGYLQGVTAGYRETIRWGYHIPVGEPHSLSTTVFTSSIAKALESIGSGTVKPGTYTLVSQPQWTLAEVYEYYERRFGVSLTRCYQPAPTRRGIRGSLKQRLLRTALHHRGLIETMVLMRVPSLFNRVKGRYRVGHANSTQQHGPDSNFVQHLIGKIPGLCIDNLESSQEQILAADLRVEAQIDGLLCAANR